MKKTGMRLFTMVGMIALTLFSVSCEDNEISISEHNNNASRAAEMRVHTLIQKVRSGDKSACKDLALCYRDGDGVKKSFLNAIFMYIQYNSKDLDSPAMLFEENDPHRVLVEMLDRSTLNKEAMDKLNAIRCSLPLEVKAIEIAYKHSEDTLDDAILQELRSLEEQGSEMAIILPIIYFDNQNDEDNLEKVLLRNADRIPLFYLLLADVEMKKFAKNGRESLDHVQNAVNYLYKADEAGMLSHRHARILINISKSHGDKISTKFSREELERLEKLTGNSDL